MIDIDAILKELVTRRGSDLHLKVNRPPLMRISSDLLPSEFPPLSEEDMQYALKQLWVSVGSDSGAVVGTMREAGAHPRAYGTFPRVAGYYVRDVHRILRPGGLFKFQVQGSPEVAHEPQNSWVGVSFTETEARQMADRCGFEMRYQYGAGDQYYWLWYFKTK